jgi:hypothetical protein
MFNINSKQSIAKQVDEVLKAHIETKGENWLVSLGYAASNDYAQSVVGLIQSLTGQYTRFETVARYIRVKKSQIRAKQRLLK